MLVADQTFRLFRGRLNSEYMRKIEDEGIFSYQHANGLIYVSVKWANAESFRIRKFFCWLENLGVKWKFYLRMWLRDEV